VVGRWHGIPYIGKGWISLFLRSGSDDLKKYKFLEVREWGWDWKGEKYKRGRGQLFILCPVVIVHLP
jgi:hypothetical protein